MRRLLARLRRLLVTLSPKPPPRPHPHPHPSPSPLPSPLLLLSSPSPPLTLTLALITHLGHTTLTHPPTRPIHRPSPSRASSPSPQVPLPRLRCSLLRARVEHQDTLVLKRLLQLPLLKRVEAMLRGGGHAHTNFATALAQAERRSFSPSQLVWGGPMGNS